VRTAFVMALVGALLATAAPARAEATAVRMSKQFGLGYLSMIIVEERRLIENHARAAGLGDVAVTWNTLSGPAAQLDALLAGQIDFIGPGVPTLATIWDRTVGTPQEIRALGALQSMPYVLVTRNPSVRTST
jgi:NitT/TauT family transport system substrate-binding protein